MVERTELTFAKLSFHLVTGEAMVGLVKIMWAVEVEEKLSVGGRGGGAGRVVPSVAA